MPALAIVLLLPGCASIQGVPIGMTDSIRTNLEATGITEQLNAADALAKNFEEARDKNLRYAFWSNMALIPLAAAATSTVAFHASRTAIAGVGIGSAALIGGNSFVNARPIARVYQSGLNALTCEIVNLKPYASAIVPSSNALKDEITAAAALEDVSGLATTQDVAAAGDLMATIQDLKAATADASKAVAAADTAAQQQQQLPIFAETATRTIANAVAAKISQTDIDFSKLTASMAPAAPPSTRSAAPATAPTASTNKQIAQLVQANADKMLDFNTNATTIQDRTDKIKEEIATITNLTADLQDRLSTYQLGAAEAAVTDCVKAVGSTT